jgi:glycosyltransferase involved in cell wall biosynthesis/SAM-dependent methyltransferase
LHDTALEYGGLFFKTYVNSEKPIKILDLGSQDVNGSLRTVAPKKAEYVGVDFADGKGVDIRITDPYKLPFEDNFFDVAVSSSCFEHSEFFWLSFLELLRVLKPEGLLYINAPSNGSFHRYPVDCWRFYPDSGIALQNWAHRNGLKEAMLLESFIGTQKNDNWNDFVAVFIKSKKYISHYEKRMISFLSEYSNAHLLGSEEVLNFKDQSFDQLTISKQETKIQTQETKIQTQENLLNLMLNSRSWKITEPLRFIRNRIGVLALFFKYKNYVKFFNLVRRDGFLTAIRSARYTISPKLRANSNFGYDQWIKAYDCFDDNDKELLKKQIKKFKSKPLISIVMPTYNSNLDWLRSAIESVQNQIYQNWELCISDDASTDKNVIKILKEYSKNDSRIKVVFRKKNGHISESSNTALSIATGHWVALLDHDDLLSETALFYVAQLINHYPDVKMIYSDEDKIDANNVRFNPYFKCDWNRDLFYSHNMFSHLGVYNAELLKSIGGFRKGFEGSQDYDLALRCLEVVGDNKVKHIPRVLYHWRAHAESTALTNKAKPYAMIAGERAINDHFKRTGIKAKAELLNHGYRVHYDLPRILPLVSIIIPTRNGYKNIKKCIESIILKTTYSNFEIIIIDNGSVDSETIDYLNLIKENPKISIKYDDRPFNYSQLNNSAADVSKGELLVLLNDDVEVINGNWLSEMVSNAMREGIGAVGARLFYVDNTLQHAGIILGLGIDAVAGHVHYNLPKGQSGYFGRAILQQNFSAVTAACLVIKKSIFNEVGGFNESKLAVVYNDVDLCLKLIEKGYKNTWTPYAELYHYESSTRGRDDSTLEIKRLHNEISFMKKTWGNSLKLDPAYSPNLALDRHDFYYAFPPRVSKFYLWKN